MSESKKVTFPVEASHIMMFARAIGDTNPVFHDADEAAKTNAAGGIVAPPTFAQAVAQFDPEHATRPTPGEKWFGSGANPSGIDGDPPSSGGLHAEQHFEYWRPLRPGDVLTRDLPRRGVVGEAKPARRPARFHGAVHRLPRPGRRARVPRAERRGKHRTPGRPGLNRG